MEDWTNSVADLRDNESWWERVEEWNTRRAQEDREFRALNPRRHTPHGRGTVEWYVPEGAEFDSDMDHGYGPRDFKHGDNPWASVADARWRILPGDVDIPTFDEEHEDWEVQVPLRRPLRPHHGVFEEYDQLILPGRELEEAFAAAEADPELQVQERAPRRAVIQITEEEVVPDTETSLSRKHVKGWNKQVADLLLEIVNDCGVKCRVIDGTHILLYPPDGKSRPFKVALSRKPEAQAFYLRKFMADWNLTPKETEKMTTTATTPTTMFTALSAGVTAKTAEEARQKAAAEPVAPEPTEEPQAPEEPIPTASDPTIWNPSDRYEGEWETDGTRYRCITCRKSGEDFTSKDGRGVAGHYRMRHSDSPLWTPETRAKAAETRRANRVRREVADALVIISKAVGIEPPVDEKEIEHLRAEVEKQKKRADEAEARLALIRETMGL